jgi:hypothetical protein
VFQPSPADHRYGRSQAVSYPREPAFLAGTSRMRWRLFLPANAAGGIVWAVSSHDRLIPSLLADCCA